MQRDGKRKWFVMTPHREVPPSEPTPAFDVHATLSRHQKYVGLILRELHHQRKHNEELTMKISELSSKIDTLIGIANDLKGRTDAPPPVTAQPDDPEIEALAHRIDDATAVLKGEKNTQTGSSGTAPPANTFDPNAPVTSDAALATDINSPQARDPNAPV